MSDGTILKTHNRIKRYLHKILRQALKLDKVYAALVPETHDDVDNPAHMARSVILFGMWMVVLVFGVLGIWSAIAKIDSAAIAPGKVVVDTNRKTISHLEGGLVEAILVRDGQIVEKNQPLIRLREVRAKAQVDLLRSQYYNGLAIEARLLAERDKKSEIAYPKELIGIKNGGPAIQKKLENTALSSDARTSLMGDFKQTEYVSEIIRNQDSIFKSRMENIRGQLDILKTRISKFQQEIKGYTLQIESMGDQVGYLNDEIQVVQKLLAAGNAQRPRLLALQRQAAELQGRKGEYLSMRAKSSESIDETKLEALNTESDYMNKVVEELKQIQMDVSEAREKMAASNDILDRIIIRSPERGIVNDMSAHTIDGVIKPGEKILEIIPMDDTMIIEAKVAPQDIDVVHPDLRARVRLTAYKSRVVPPVDGKVIFVAADSSTDERTGQSYFISRIEIPAEELSKLDQGVQLYPGMPADALIITGSRTFFQYLMDPITQSFNHSFLQQ